MHRTRPVQLIAVATRRVEIQEVQYLLHGDLSTQYAEVHARHVLPFTACHLVSGYTEKRHRYFALRVAFPLPTPYDRRYVNPLIHCTSNASGVM